MRTTSGHAISANAACVPTVSPSATYMETTPVWMCGSAEVWSRRTATNVRFLALASPRAGLSPAATGAAARAAAVWTRKLRE
jgi:hypothetical protein